MKYLLTVLVSLLLITAINAQKDTALQNLTWSPQKEVNKKLKPYSEKELMLENSNLRRRLARERVFSEAVVGDLLSCVADIDSATRKYESGPYYIGMSDSCWINNAFNKKAIKMVVYFRITPHTLKFGTSTMETAYKDIWWEQETADKWRYYPDENITMTIDLKGLVFSISDKGQSTSFTLIE